MSEECRHSKISSQDFVTCEGCGFKVKDILAALQSSLDTATEEIAALRESLGLLQIGHDHKATLLASCEIALGERDEKISTLQSELAAAREEIASLVSLIKEYEFDGRVARFLFCLF